MRTNYPASYNSMDMGSPNFFSYNVDALVSMTNQQLEVRNELHMHAPTPPAAALAPPTARRLAFLRPRC